METSELKPGDEHYMAYVGPPGQYDFMGATQFRLLTTLGMRSHHSLLDVGCGSLRAGRLFLVYLDEGRYFGIEPNAWLVEEAIDHQVGRDLVALKQPHFDHNSDFATDVFGAKFDFIVAQSIFSHTALDLARKALRNIAGSLEADGLAAITFVEGADDHPGDDWVYPGCVTFRPATIDRIAREVGLHTARLPWYHPRQTWYLLAKDPARLPGGAMLRHLTGGVLNAPEFAESWRGRPHDLRSVVGRSLPRPVKAGLRRLLGKR